MASRTAAASSATSGAPERPASSSASTSSTWEGCRASAHLTAPLDRGRPTRALRALRPAMADSETPPTRPSPDLSSRSKFWRPPRSRIAS
eukprot:scaffold94430_cov19-Prasinocladus_malaysianus.AAC.1